MPKVDSGEGRELIAQDKVGAGWKGSLVEGLGRGRVGQREGWTREQRVQGVERTGH
jgi:hypothetical protein